MTQALDTPKKQQFHKVTFTYGDPEQTKRFTNKDSNLDIAGLSFTSLPNMEFTLAENKGTLVADITKIKMWIDDDTTAFLTPLTRGTPFAQVEVVIQEVIDPVDIGDAGTEQFVFKGRILRTRKNADGKNGLCVLECVTQKGDLNVKLGFQINPNCTWRLNGPGCNESSHGPTGYDTQAMTITIDGKQVIVSDPLLLLDRSSTQTWARGFIKRDDKAVGIQYYDKAQDGNTSKTFIMVRQPPDEWDGQSVTFFPGCTKQIDGNGGCRVAWDNEEGWGGSGYAIPAYYPIAENPYG